MSPHIRRMLEDAADDQDRPVRLDLAAVRAAGRRAAWRRRILVGGSGVGAAAVVTSVAVLLAPVGPAPSRFEPGGSGTSAPSATPTADEYGVYADELTAGLAPLMDALAERGYEAVTDGTLGGGAVTMVDAYGQTGEAGTASALVLPVVKDGGTGVAVVAEFTDVAALSQIVEGDPPADGLCAVVPALDATGFGWDTCDLLGDDDSIRHQTATGGGADSDALGVTLIRPDGSGISVSLSTASFDRPDGQPTQPLGEVPLTAEQLLAVVDQLEALTPIAPPMPTGVPEGLPTGPDGCVSHALEPSAGAADSAGIPPPPPGDEPCQIAEARPISSDPLVEALAKAGVDTEDVGGTGSGGPGEDVAHSVRFRLTDSAGRSGTASIGIANSLEVAPLMNDTSVAWCAVTPTSLGRNFTWDLADDPSTRCSDTDNEASNPLVVVHDEPDADAIGATLVRADGSVISVAVSQAPYQGIGVAGDPMTELPLDRESILDLLTQLDAANPVS